MTRFRILEESGQYISATFRSIRLHLLWQLTKARKTDEIKKTAIYKRRSIAVLHIFLHIIPVTASFALFVLNFNSKYVGIIPVNALAALQFAAKLLEILIQASIAAIVLALIRYRVLKTSKLPFGGLVAPYRISDISSLWSLDFWGCLTAPALKPRTRLILCLVLPTAVILAAVVGPSCAVLMIPRPTQGFKVKQLQLLGPTDRIFPIGIELEDDTLTEEYSFNATSYQASEGLTRMRPGPIIDDQMFRNFKYSSGQSGSYNRSSVATVPVSLPIQVRPSYDLATITTTASVKQPYVYSSCWTSSTDVEITDSMDRYVDFGPDKTYLNQFLRLAALLPGQNSSRTDPVVLYQRNVTPTENCQISNTAFSIAWSRGPGHELNHSLLMVFTPQVSENLLRPVACTIDAYWATANTNVSETGALETELPATINDTDRTLSKLKDKVLLRLNPEWAKRVSILADERGQAVCPEAGSMYAYVWQGLQYALALSYIPQMTSNKYLTFSRHYLQPNNASYLRDDQYNKILSYISGQNLLRLYDEVIVWANGDIRTDPSDMAQIAGTSWISGYGYDSSTITVKLALTVILIYLLGTVVYLAHSVGTGYAATSWDSIAELVALALNSEPPESLENASVGIDTLETFRRPVNVRVNQQGSLEIVFDEEDQSTYKLVTANERY